MSLAYALPAEAGINPKGITELLKTLSKKNCHSIMILRHGKIITEGWWSPYSKELPHVLYSLSKSFTSIAYAFAFQENLISPEDEVLPYLRSIFTAEPCEYFKKVKISHLLSMTMGHQKETEYVPYDNWLERFTKQYIENEPGSVFYYDNSNTYLAGVILEKITGVSLEEFLTPRLFKPLGFQKGLWEKSPEGHSKAFCGLNLRTEDIAKFGQLLLNKGTWEGKQLLRADIVEEMTKSHISNRGDGTGYPDCIEGYSYFFWRCHIKDSYRGDGANGQYCVVLPEQDMVIAITAGFEPMNDILMSVWDKLLPAVDSFAEVKEEDQQELEELIKELKIELPEALGTEKLHFDKKTYAFTENSMGIMEVSMEISAEQSIQSGNKNQFKFLTKDGTFTYLADSKEWTYGENQRTTEEDCLRTTFFKNSVSCGIWKDNIYELHIIYINTPFHDTYGLEFRKDHVRVHYKRFPAQVYHSGFCKLIGTAID